MAKKTSENYLDNLLNSINGDNAFETEEDFSSDDFLREFENELVSEEYSNYMADFELEIEAERNKDLDLFVGDDKSEFDIEEFSLDDAIEKLEKEELNAKEEEKENPVTDEPVEDIPEEQLEEMPENQDDAIGFDEALLSAAKEAESSSPIIEEIGEPHLAGNSDSDLMDLLGEDAGLADIGNLLMEGEEITEASEEAFEELAEKESGEGEQNTEVPGNKAASSKDSGSEKTDGK